MKSYSIAKYNLWNSRRSIAIYYSIFIIVCIMIVLNGKLGSGSASGIELSTAIFLFILGLNSFKENFYFSQCNNISRKTYYKGTILSIMPIAAIASLIDIIINRILNLVIKCPTNYEMIFTSLRDLNVTQTWTEDGVVKTGVKGIEYWVQSNDLMTLVSTYLFQFSVYIIVIAVGLTIALIYYKCNKLMKTIVSIIPILFIIVINIVSSTFIGLFSEIGEFIQTIFGWNTRNPYAAIATFIVIFTILVGCIYLLVKKAIIKER